MHKKRSNIIHLYLCVLYTSPYCTCGQRLRDVRDKASLVGGTAKCSHWTVQQRLMDQVLLPTTWAYPDKTILQIIQARTKQQPQQPKNTTKRWKLLVRSSNSATVATSTPSMRRARTSLFYGRPWKRQTLHGYLPVPWSRKRDHWISAEVLIYQYFNWLGGGSFWVISVACQLGIDQNWPRGGSRQGGPPPPPPLLILINLLTPPPPLALTAFRIDQMDWGGGGGPLPPSIPKNLQP